MTRFTRVKANLDIQIPEQRVGNPEAIAVLERALETARSHGGVTYAAVAMIMGENMGSASCGGRAGLESVAQKVVHSLYFELERLQKEQMLGERNYGLDSSHVEYPLSGAAPLNWDFLVWLVDAEMTRRRLGGHPPLKVWFAKRDMLPKDRAGVVDWVIEPLVELLGGIITPQAEGGRHKRIFVPSDIIARARAGEQVPRFRGTPKGRSVVASVLHGAKPVVITLRETNYLEFRNSNIEAWIQFGRYLQNAEGREVVFVRDTAKAFEPLEDFTIFPKAALDIQVRMALYEAAECNMFVSNGPGGLCIFSELPYIYLTNIKPEFMMYEPNSTEWWEREHGLAEGDQWPWAAANQRTVWATDDYDSICRAWNEWFHHASPNP